jgi:2-polyprenyl-3-methyl-5-hydroxy-6-metoxy-1,4-benzoquinol methylase
LKILEFFYGKNVSDEFVNNKLNWDSDGSLKKRSRKLSKIADVKIKKCSLCGTTYSKKVCSFYGVNYHRCKKCDLVYSDRILSEKAMEKFYTDDKNYTAKAYTSKNLLKMREDLIKPKIKFVKKFVKGKKWLDIGSADGSAVKAIMDEGFTVLGTEISDRARDFAKKYRKINLYPKTLESLALENKTKWNAITFFGVIDIIPDPLSALKTSHKILAKNGIICIQVPNHDSISTKIQKLTTEPDRHLTPPIAIRQFTTKSLEYALKKSGFKPIATWIWGMDMIEFIKYLRRENSNFKNSEIDKFLTTNLNGLQYVFDSKNQGDSLLMIGRKMS